MIEAAALIAKDGSVIHWHLPPGRTSGSIPDTRDLWEVIWENRENVLGLAHTHPWNGAPYPSETDLTTFDAIERALGRRLVWWVVTFDHVGRIDHRSDEHIDDEYLCAVDAEDPIDLAWLEELRTHSHVDPLRTARWADLIVGVDS